VENFISEEDLRSWEGWLRYQGIDATTQSPEELAAWRRIFDEARQRIATLPKVVLMKLQAAPGEHLYAVAVREGADLWLTLWVRRSWNGEFFVLRPYGERDWESHASYHLDGTLHLKSGCRIFLPRTHQPLTDIFRESVHLEVHRDRPVTWSQHTWRHLNDPGKGRWIADRANRLRHVAIVGPVEPGQSPTEFPWAKIVVREVFRDTTPRVVITVGS